MYAGSVNFTVAKMVILDENGNSDMSIVGKRRLLLEVKFRQHVATTGSGGGGGTLVMTSDGPADVCPF